MSDATRCTGALPALDLGTTTGWAIRTTCGSITSGTMTFKPGRFEGGGMRFLRFRRWLDELRDTAGPIAEVRFEEVRRRAGVDAAHAYGGFMGHLTAWCENCAIPYQGVPVGSIKKHATGKGNADKQAMVDAMTRRGYRPADDTRPTRWRCCSWRSTRSDATSAASSAMTSSADHAWRRHMGRRRQIPPELPALPDCRTGSGGERRAMEEGRRRQPQGSAVRKREDRRAAPGARR